MHHLLNFGEPDIDGGIFRYDNILVEGDRLAFTRVHTANLVTLVLVVDRADTLEHLWEVTHDILNLFRVADDLEKVLVTDEVEASEILSLLLQVLTESLLDELQRSSEVLQGLLEVGDLHNLKHDGLLIHMLHQLGEV